MDFRLEEKDRKWVLGMNISVKRKLFIKFVIERQKYY